MERRNFLKLAFGVVAGAAAIAASAQAAPLLPQAVEAPSISPRGEAIRPAVTSSEEIAQLRPEQVRWGHGHWHRRHWGWHRRHWGWHRRHWGWRHRHWGWHRRHWRHW